MQCQLDSLLQAAAVVEITATQPAQMIISAEIILGLQKKCMFRMQQFSACDVRLHDRHPNEQQPTML